MKHRPFLVDLAYLDAISNIPIRLNCVVSVTAVTPIQGDSKSKPSIVITDCQIGRFSKFLGTLDRTCGMTYTFMQMCPASQSVAFWRTAEQTKTDE